MNEGGDGNDEGGDDGGDNRGDDDDNDDVDDDELDGSKKDAGLDNLNAGDGKYGSWLWGHKCNQPRWNAKASKQSSEKNFV